MRKLTVKEFKAVALAEYGLSENAVLEEVKLNKHIHIICDKNVKSSIRYKEKETKLQSYLRQA